MKHIERYLQNHSALVKTILMLAAIVTLIVSVVAFVPRPPNDPLYSVRGDSLDQRAIRDVMEEMRKPPPARPTATPPVNMPQAHMHIQLPGGLDKNTRLEAELRPQK